MSILVGAVALLAVAAGALILLRPWDAATPSASTGAAPPPGTANPPAAALPAPLSSTDPSADPSAVIPSTTAAPAGIAPAGIAPVGIAPSAGQPAAPGPPGTPGVPGPPKPPTNVTVTYEAESGANLLRGSAIVAPFTGSSGGRVVTDIGNWHIAGNNNPGTLRFNAVRAPETGRYALVVFAVNSSGAPSNAIISIPGNQPIHLAVPAGAGCCVSHTFLVNLTAGLNPITFSNPHDRAPAIDRITLTPRP
ncbi:MAG: hypothetical protein J2P15_09505 [Micromonosporaceae bacterium]|nr:hypothetical protein [Micromonosporaceae bacterium]